MSHRRKVISAIFLFVLLIVTGSSDSSASVIDKVVAYIDDEAITLSELREDYARAIKIKPDITKREVLVTMINRRLLIREAKNLRLVAPDDQTLLDEYIDLKVKAFITIKDSEIAEFYENNRSEFQGLALEDVKDRIEEYLREEAVNRALKKHIGELMAKSNVRILLGDED